MIANRYKIGSGTGKGFERLVSFDNALINGGVANYNLVRLSSILPLAACEAEDIDLPLGSLLPVAYATYSTDKPGVNIASAIAIGFPKEVDSEHCAVIMEYEGECTRSEAVSCVLSMVKDAFSARKWELLLTETSASEAVSEAGEWVSVFSYVAEWEESK